MHEFFPRKAGVFCSIDIFNISLEDKLEELLFVIDGDFQYFQLDLSGIVETFSDELEVDDSFVSVEIFVFVFDFEDEFVDGISHGDDDSVILQNDSVEGANDLVDAECRQSYEAISFIPIYKLSGARPFLDRSS